MAGLFQKSERPGHSFHCVPNLLVGRPRRSRRRRRRPSRRRRRRRWSRRRWTRRPCNCHRRRFGWWSVARLNLRFGFSGQQNCHGWRGNPCSPRLLQEIAAGFGFTFQRVDFRRLLVILRHILLLPSPTAGDCYSHRLKVRRPRPVSRVSRKAECNLSSIPTRFAI